MRVLAMIMAGGASEALSVLTAVRSEPSIPFAGKFRIVDFPLSNCVNSSIFSVVAFYRGVVAAKTLTKIMPAFKDYFFGSP